VIIQHVKRTGLGPVRRFSTVLGAVALAVAAPILSPSAAQAAAIAFPQGQDVDAFYQLRSGKPLWFQGKQPTAAAQSLISLLTTANADGLDPQRYGVDQIAAALKHASGSGDQRSVRKADQLLSEAFTAYARDLRNFPATNLQYVDPALRSGPPSPLRLLQDAADAPSLVLYVANMRWMNPEYLQLRHALGGVGNGADNLHARTCALAQGSETSESEGALDPGKPVRVRRGTQVCENRLHAAQARRLDNH